MESTWDTSDKCRVHATLFRFLFFTAEEKERSVPTEDLEDTLISHVGPESWRESKINVKKHPSMDRKGKIRNYWLSAETWKQIRFYDPARIRAEKISWVCARRRVEMDEETGTCFTLVIFSSSAGRHLMFVTEYQDFYPWTSYFTFTHVAALHIHMMTHWLKPPC